MAEATLQPVRFCAGCDVCVVRGAAATNFENRKIGDCQQVSMRYLPWDMGHTKLHDTCV